ncbi:MAG: alpha/beta fold hydrolase [Sphingomonadales bacterium]
MAKWTDVNADLPEGVTVQRSGAGEPIVLIAGNGGGISFWEGRAASLDDYELIGFDYRGAPLRADDGHLFETARRKAQDLTGILDSLGLEKAIILGHSTGAQAAIRFAAAHPERIKHLIISGGYAAPHPFITESMGLRKSILQDLGPDAFMLDSLFRAIPPAHLFTQMEEQGADGILSFRQAPDVEIESARIDQIIEGDVSAFLADLSVPTSVLHARNDSVFPFALGEALAEAIEGANLIAIEEGSHLAPILAPQSYAAAARQALG